MLVAFVLVGGLAAAPPPGPTAADMLADCQAALVDAKALSREGVARAAHCLGYLAGTVDAHALISGLTPTARRWCEPAEGITVDARARVVVAYLEQNPKRLHLGARVEVMRAMQAAFPCAQANGPRLDPFDDVPDMDLPPGSRLVPVSPPSSTAKDL